jgi:D-alanyl-D-alanine carboxypeptidase/D-alanyl-D-alanine-endopeptidase (penicillin-binding protein 4)
MSLLRLLLIAPLLALPARAEGPATVRTGEAVGAAPTAGAPSKPAVSGSAAQRREAVATALALAERDPLFGSAQVSAQVVDVESGQEVWHHGEDRALVPASVMKVLTMSTVLRELGPSWRVPTWFMSDGALKPDGTLEGSLYVKGQGDPTMVVERLWRVALDLKLKGVQVVAGDLVLDAGYFEGGASPIPGWNNREDLANPPSYYPLLSALSVNYNLVQLSVRPGASGEPAVAVPDIETPAVVLDNQVRTGAKGARASIRVTRTLDERTRVVTFHLTGTIPEDGAVETFYRPVGDPVGHYASVFVSMLRQQGIAVRGRVRRGGTPADARLLLRTESEPLASLAAHTSKSSNNFYAEQLLRILGAERKAGGTTERGLEVIAAHLVALGIPREEFKLVNGSGLSRDTILRPSHVNAVLIDAARDPALGPEFIASLSVAGRDGTLWSRFREDTMDGRLRGKTGTLAGVSALAGYVRGVDDRLYAFTVFTNGIQGAPGRARATHDKLVRAMAGTGSDVADVGEPEASP